MQNQVKEIMEIVQLFHSNLSVEYLSLKKDAYDERSQMLLDYLSSRERRVAKCLGEYIHDSESRVLNMWVKYVPSFPGDVFSYCMDGLSIKPPLHVEDILDIAIHYDNCLINYLSTLLRESAQSDEVTLFGYLLKVAKKEEKNLAKNVLWLNDI